MDKYQRAEKPRRDDHTTQVEPNEIRITQQGKVRSYISYGHGLFTEKNERCIVLKAMGNAISKAVTVAEILKHRVASLHMVTRISSIETVDVYDPLEEGLDRIETKRKIPSISIHLSLDALDRDEPGYQSPIPADQVSTGSPSYSNSREFRKARGQSRRSGRSGGRGNGRGRGGGGGGDVGDGEADATVVEIAEIQEKVEQEAGGDDAVAESTPTIRGKRGKGRGWGRSGSNGGRGRKSGDQSPTNEGDGHAESSSAVENEAVASTPTGRKPGRGRKGKKTSSSGDQEKQIGDGEGDDETGETVHANHRGGRGRHSGRGRNRGRGRGRGLSESTGCDDGNGGSLDTADVNTAPDNPPASE